MLKVNDEAEVYFHSELDTCGISGNIKILLTIGEDKTMDLVKECLNRGINSKELLDRLTGLYLANFEKDVKDLLKEMEQK